MIFTSGFQLMLFLWCHFQDVPLGGWSVERSVDGEAAIVYKFTPKYVLKSGCYVTVSYSFSLYCKNQSCWLSFDTDMYHLTLGCLGDN